MSDKSLINLDGLSKPATVLVKRVCAAIGALYEPTHIRRVARAQADADKIRAVAEIEISDLERRALQRLVHEEGRKQENIEKILADATAQLGEDARPEDLQDDWISKFFEECRHVSDSEMQSLWAKLLAGEARAPGSYSKRTIAFVSDLDKRDASLFTSLCSCCWQIGNLVPLVFDSNHEIYKKLGLSFSALQHLDDIGLISFGGVAGFAKQQLPKYITGYYYGRLIQLELPSDSSNSLEIGHALLTNVGNELAPICGSGPSNEFFDYVIKRWFEQNLKPRSPLVMKPQ